MGDKRENKAEAQLISTLLIHVDPISTRLSALHTQVTSLGEASDTIPAAHKQLMHVQSLLTKIHFLLTRPSLSLSTPLRDAVRLNAVHLDAHLRRTTSVLAGIEDHVARASTAVLRFLRTDSVCKQLNQVLHNTAAMRAACQGLISEILLGKLRDDSDEDNHNEGRGSENAANEGDEEHNVYMRRRNSCAAAGAHGPESDRQEERPIASRTEPRAMRLSSVPPSDLPSALRSVLLGAHTPAQCLPLIRRGAVSGSLSAWYAAHELLMLAVADDAALATAHYGARDSFWLLHLYQPVTLFRLPDAAERRRVVRCLREAEAAGPLELAAAVIGDIFVMDAVNRQLDLAARADAQLWLQVLGAQRQLADLTAALRDYRRTQRFSQLVGVALHLIPIAGGALAGALAAGADFASSAGVGDAAADGGAALFRSEMCKNLVEGVLGYGIELAAHGVESLRDRLLERGRDAVSDEVLASMDDQKRGSVVRAIEQSGMSVGVLRELLDSRSGGRYEPTGSVSTTPSSALHVDTVNLVTIGAGVAQGGAVGNKIMPERVEKKKRDSDVTDNPCSSSHEASWTDVDAFSVDEDSMGLALTVCDEPTIKYGSWWRRESANLKKQREQQSEEEENLLLVQSPQPPSRYSDRRRAGGGMAVESRREYDSPSDYTGLPLDGTTAGQLSQEEVAKWWAAFSVEFNDVKSDAFNKTWPVLLEFLIDEELNGMDLGVGDEDIQLISSTAIDSVARVTGRLPFGRKRKLARFLAQLSAL